MVPACVSRFCGAGVPRASIRERQAGRLRHKKSRSGHAETDLDGPRSGGFFDTGPIAWFNPSGPPPPSRSPARSPFTMPRPPAFLLWLATLASGVALGLALGTHGPTLSAQSAPTPSAT